MHQLSFLDLLPAPPPRPVLVYTDITPEEMRTPWRLLPGWQAVWELVGREQGEGQYVQE